MGQVMLAVAGGSTGIVRQLHAVHGPTVTHYAWCMRNIGFTGLHTPSLEAPATLEHLLYKASIKGRGNTPFSCACAYFHAV